jgi:hypothetical protein
MVAGLEKKAAMFFHIGRWLGVLYFREYVFQTVDSRYIASKVCTGASLA